MRPQFFLWTALVIHSALFRRLLDAAFLICLSIATLYAGARLTLMPRDSANGVAVVFAPWTAPEQTLTRAVGAGARFVSYGGLPFVAVVAPESADYPARILGAGAWLVTDPAVLAACLGFVKGAAQP
jgi:hypothetical protein